MSIQPDTWIKKMCKEHKMIEPFLDHQVSEGKISYGLSSMGYDVRISDEYRIFTNVNTSLVDPKNFSEENFIEKKAKRLAKDGAKENDKKEKVLDASKPITLDFLTNPNKE